jgi:hypothetical protein
MKITYENADNEYFDPDMVKILSVEKVSDEIYRVIVSTPKDKYLDLNFGHSNGDPAIWFRRSTEEGDLFNFVQLTFDFSDEGFNVYTIHGIALKHVYEFYFIGSKDHDFGCIRGEAVEYELVELSYQKIN